MLSDGSRALLKDDIVPLLEREKRHTKKLLRTRYPEHCQGDWNWFMSVKNTKCFLGNFFPPFGASAFPLSTVIDLLHYYTSFRNTKSANLLKELEALASRPHEPNVPIPVKELVPIPSLDKFTECIVQNLSDALANCKDSKRRSEVVSIIQSLITLL